MRFIKIWLEQQCHASNIILKLKWLVMMNFTIVVLATTSSLILDNPGEKCTENKFFSQFLKVAIF